jgi:hypothetical protein
MKDEVTRFSVSRFHALSLCEGVSNPTGGRMQA